MTRDQFIQREIATWGEDYIFDLIDRGYEVVQLTNGTQVKWCWHFIGLTTSPESATVIRGSDSAFTPVFVGYRASRK